MLQAGAAVFVAVAAVLWQWQPPEPPTAAAPSDWPALDHYLYTPAEAAFRCAGALSWMASWGVPPLLVGYRRQPRRSCCRRESRCGMHWIAC